MVGRSLLPLSPPVARSSQVHLNHPASGQEGLLALLLKGTRRALFGCCVTSSQILPLGPVHSIQSVLGAVSLSCHCPAWLRLCPFCYSFAGAAVTMALGCILCQSPSIDAHVHVCALFWADGSCEDTRLESCAFARLCSPNSCANCSLLLVLVMALLHVLLKRGSFPRSSEPDPVRAGFCISFVVPIAGMAGQVPLHRCCTKTESVTA